MSYSTNSEKLSDLSERAKCLVVSSVIPATRTSYDSYWNQFSAFCNKNNLSNLSVVNDEAPNHVACFITAVEICMTFESQKKVKLFCTDFI